MGHGKLLCVALLVSAPAPAWQTASAPKADPALAHAVQQARSGKCNEAVETLRARLRVAPKPEEGVYRLLADCHLTLAQPDDALQTLRDGMRAYPASPLIAGGLGQLLFRRRSDSAEAGQLLALAAKSQPQNPESHHYYAQWAYLNGRERICVQEEQNGLRGTGLNDLALLQMNTLLGMCASQIEDEDGARAAFQTAQQVNLRLAAFDPVAAFQFIQFERRYGDDSKVQALVEQVLQRVPQFGPAHLERAKYFDRAKNSEKAIEEAEAALRSQGNDFNTERAAHAILARSHKLLGHAEAAQQEQLWIETHPNAETRKN